MRLTILGCSGSVPGPGTNASGYLLEADGFLLALDLGNGTVSALQQLRDPFALDALLLSHLHPDHCADFGALTVIRRYHPERLAAGRPQRLPVYGPEGTEQRLINLYAPDERERAETDLSDVYTFAPLPTEPAMIGPFEVRAVEVAHPTPAYGVRTGTAEPRSPTPVTPACARRWTSWPQVPTCCWPRRPGRTPTTVRRASTCPGSRSAGWPSVQGSAGC